MKEGKYRVMLIKIANLEKKEKLDDNQKIQLELMKAEVKKYEDKYFPL